MYYPLYTRKIKWWMWSGKFMERSGINVYNVLLTGDKIIPSNDADKTKEKGISVLKVLIKTSYNELILAPEDMVCFQTVEESNTKANKQRDERQACIKL